MRMSVCLYSGIMFYAFVKILDLLVRSCFSFIHFAGECDVCVCVRSVKSFQMFSILIIRFMSLLGTSSAELFCFLRNAMHEGIVLPSG